MTQWYVKDFSNLAGVSIQALHLYDRINLLKPSVRHVNGYRLYSEKDLVRLQQIIALKFFGFELAQIKKLLEVNSDIIEHFSTQARVLERKAKNLFEASQTLKRVVSDAKNSKSIHWEEIVNLIEVYNMIQNIEKTWIGKILIPEEVKQYAEFQTSLKSRFTEEEHKIFEKNWAELIAQIESNLSKDPKSKFGADMANQFMEMVTHLYGEEYNHLTDSLWEKGFKKGIHEEEHLLSQKVVEWIDIAINTHYKKV